ncbi:MAG: AraC family transcriptional regulator ligand-binding domain-containing protein [Nevskia sp.]|nr:AraC family transcriptional regulator ligand-binding domain-containing protein [Nevskia sp.]
MNAALAPWPRKVPIAEKRAYPVAYVLLLLDIAAERGVSRDRVLANLPVKVPAQLLQRPGERFSLLQYVGIIGRILHLTGDPALGYEFGLRCRATTHGFFGYGMISQATLQEVLEFTIKFIPLCMPCYSLSLTRTDRQAVLDVSENVPFGPLRQLGMDKFLVAFATSLRMVANAPMPELELQFDYPEPPYYCQYRERLPTVRFAAGVNQIRFPAEFLAHPLPTADATTARLVTEQCERELSLSGHTDDFMAAVRAAMPDGKGGYLTVDEIAKRLFTSRRTLHRRLHEHGVNYRHLVDEIRHRESIRLLESSPFSVEEIAAHLGYNNAQNFNRAFRRWAGMPPGAYRAQFSGTDAADYGADNLSRANSLR